MKRVGLTFRYRHKAEPYADALRRAGLDPMLLTPEQPVAFPLSEVHGLVLSGGPDVNPARYRQAPHAQTTPPDNVRDEFETGLLMEAIARGLPVLGICRGMQLLNVALGGALHQHIEHHEVRNGDPSRPVHEVAVDPHTILSRVFGRTRAAVNSRHHQSVHRLGAGLAVSAVADDRTVEAVEHTSARFLVGVQWHPEDQVRTCPVQRLLFSAYAACVMED
jgi:gamma-glutamyl-gamma-aminobutyrate hydrolase PuuD